MTKKGIKNEIADLKARIEERLEKLYPSETRDGKKVFFLNETETASIVCVWLNENDPFFVVEYGSGDDGDRHYPSESKNQEALIDDILEEIRTEMLEIIEED